MTTARALIGIYIKHKLPFALYRLPESNAIQLVAQLSNTQTTVDDNFDFTAEYGFVLSPFIKEKNTTQFIKAEKQYTFQHLEEVVENSNTETIENVFTPTVSEYIATEKENYVEAVAKSVEAIKNGDFEKVVLSGITIKEVSKDFDLANYFEKLCSQYPNVLVYLLFTTETGFWMGATPELLLQFSNKQLQTVSLAGTKLLRKNTAEMPWQQKEIDEQHLVTQHIQECFQQHFNEPLEISETKTISTGHLLHLRTDFKLQSQNGSLQKHYFSFLKALHPTPAVGGSPKEKAIAHIKKTEPHERSYYTGYLGFINPEGVSNIFVNLRCLKYESGKLILFTGAGITKDSNPEKEWEEIQLKAETLLKVLE